MSVNYGDIFQRLHNFLLDLPILRNCLSWWKCNKKNFLMLFIILCNNYCLSALIISYILIYGPNITLQT